MAMQPPPHPADGVIGFYEQLTPDHLQRLHTLYATDARFKDPFNDVQGLEAISGIFVHMYASLHEPRFVITTRIVDGSQAFLGWDFMFRFRRFDTGTTQTVRGGSHLVFNDAGLVTLHRDYWDAAEELYEKLPVVGGLMRWLRKRANS
jgi:hypothetical protein